MYKRSGELLNKFQREEFLNSIFSMNTYELGAFYMLSKKDLKIISSKRPSSVFFPKTPHLKIKP